MIFIDKIDNAIQILKYLESRLSKRIWKEQDIEYIIHTFFAKHIIISRLKFLASFLSSNTYIEIYMEYASMGINL